MNVSTTAAHAYFTHASKQPAKGPFGAMAFQRLTARVAPQPQPAEPTAKPAVTAREEAPSQPVKLTKAPTTAIEHAVNHRPATKAPVTAREATNGDPVSRPATTAGPTGATKDPAVLASDVQRTSAATQLTQRAPVDLVA